MTTINETLLSTPVISVAEVTIYIEDLEAAGLTDTPYYSQYVDLLDDLLGRGTTLRWRRGKYPLTLIRDDHMVPYVRDMLASMGQLPRKIAPELVIDWDATVARVKATRGFEPVSVQGVTYWYRGA